MTRPRSALISLEATPYYHCIARCVRRAFLCGQDRYSGKNFDHRKPWLTERLGLLAEVFAIDIAAYAVMSNHYHVVLHVDSSRGKSWSEADVVERWTRLYSGPELVQRYKAGESLTTVEQSLMATLVTRWRERLCSISWFMRCMNEHLARKANAEDGCKGRFWEARFKSQALLDETALLSCMAYVDLNPIRAGIAQDLEHSDFTSVQARVLEVKARRGKTRATKSGTRNPCPMPFAEAMRDDQRFSTIPFQLKDYLELVDWTGRIVRPDKRGYIGESMPRLLGTLKLSTDEWRVLSLEIQKQAITMLHGIDTLKTLKRRRLKTAA